MSFYDWMLALHLLAAFSIAAALVLYSVLVVAGRRMETLEQTRLLFRVAPVGGPLIGAGMGLTLLLGIVLAIDSDAFQLWDLWVIAAIVLWALFGEVGRRTGTYYTETQKLAENGGAGRRDRSARAAACTHRRAVALRERRGLPPPGPRHDLQAGSVTVLASIRPDSINFALLVHVLGAMVMVGALVTAVAAALVGWRDETGALSRLSYKTLLYVALPSFIVMRVGAQWVYAKEHLDDLPEDPAWVGIGFITSDLGGLLLLVALILGGIGLRRSRSGGGGGLLKASSVIATLLVAIYIVAIWAMGAKPT